MPPMVLDAEVPRVRGPRAQGAVRGRGLHAFIVRSVPAAARRSLLCMSVRLHNALYIVTFNYKCTYQHTYSLYIICKYIKDILYI